jgi:hypothetical protein
MADILSTSLTDLGNGKLGEPAKAVRSETAIASEVASVEAAHNDGDVYKLFQVPGNAIPLFITYKNSAVTGGTDYDLGLYEVGTDGAVKDADVLDDGRSFATAASSTVWNTPFAIGDVGKAFYELAGDTEYTGQEYVVALTANTVGTAAGTIRVNLFFKYAG